MRHDRKGGGRRHDGGVGLEVGGHLEAPARRGRSPALWVEAQVVAGDGAAAQEAQVAALGLRDDPVLAEGGPVLSARSGHRLTAVNAVPEFVGGR